MIISRNNLNKNGFIINEIKIVNELLRIRNQTV